ncbi:MAG TPA: dihydroorotase [Deltaproteobacteria bacterium]|nr:dihydroorotase [Deltaproteobacteria bacterium]
MERVVVRGGRLIDPAAGIDGLYDVVVMGGRVASVRPAGAGEAGGEGWLEVDASGKVVAPGLVDLHTHLREPGQEYKETIRSGAEAAAAGGFTTILCMANTDPVNDNASVTRHIAKKAAGAPARVLPVGAVTVGLRGERLTEMAEMREAGCAAFSDDGVPVACGSVMRRALEYARICDAVVISHADDTTLSASGVMNEGAVATRLGLRGIPNAAEDAMTARDIALAELTGARLHLAHVSTAGSVELIRAAKARGVNVTAEATPHHLTLTDEAVEERGAMAKMAPPLRTRRDVEALRRGLADGTIDCVATDHAPHSPMDKDVEFELAANGVVGLETALALVLRLVDEGVLSLSDALAAMTSRPAAALGLDCGTLAVGSRADLAVIDLERTWTVEPDRFRSRGRNTPFAGMELRGAVTLTMLEGKVVYRRGGEAP